jgi:hypothetical protein
MSIKIRQELPREWRNLMIRALKVYENQLEMILHSDEYDYITAWHESEFQAAIFDMHQLRAMMKSDVIVELSEDEYENFTANNGVDFPIFITKTNN